MAWPEDDPFLAGMALNQQQRQALMQPAPVPASAPVPTSPAFVGPMATAPLPASGPYGYGPTASPSISPASLRISAASAPSGPSGFTLAGTPFVNQQGQQVGMRQIAPGGPLVGDGPRIGSQLVTPGGTVEWGAQGWAPPAVSPAVSPAGQSPAMPTQAPRFNDFYTWVRTPQGMQQVPNNEAFHTAMQGFNAQQTLGLQRENDRDVLRSPLLAPLLSAMLNSPNFRGSSTDAAARIVSTIQNLHQQRNQPAPATGQTHPGVPNSLAERFDLAATQSGLPGPNSPTQSNDTTRTSVIANFINSLTDEQLRNPDEVTNFIRNHPQLGQSALESFGSTTIYPWSSGPHAAALRRLLEARQRIGGTGSNVYNNRILNPLASQRIVLPRQ